MPPRLADVPLQLDAQRAVIPKALQAAIDFARLEQEPTPFAEGYQLIHFHESRTRCFLQFWPLSRRERGRVRALT